MFASIVFFMVNKLNLKFRWNVLFTAFIVIGSLALFEIGEYYLDYLFDLKLQGVFLRDIEGVEKYRILLDRNDDTMLDSSLGVIGTGIFAFYAWIFHDNKS